MAVGLGKGCPLKATHLMVVAFVANGILLLISKFLIIFI